MRQHHRVDPVGAGGPAPRLHGPQPLDLARRADHGDARLGRQRVAGEVELGQRHRLVVEAARGGPDLVGRRGDGGDALPLLVGVGARLGDQRAVDLAGGQQADQQRADRTAVLHVVELGAGPHGVGLDDRAEPVGRRAAADLPVRVRGVRADLRGLHLGVLARRRRSTAATAPRSAGRPGAEVPAQRAAGAHLDQLGQVGVLVDADGVRRADGDAGAALDAAVGVDHAGLELPEPDLARRLGDPVHLLADAVALHGVTASAAPTSVDRSSSACGAPGPEVEGLAGPALLAVPGDHPEQRVGHPVDRHGAGDPVDERGVGPERAAEADVDRLFDVLVDVRDVAPEADVGDLGLGARGRAAREVHADHAGVVAAPLASSPDDSCASSARAHLTARSLVSTTAKRQNSEPGAGDDAALEGPGERRVRLHERLGQQVVEPLLGDARRR